MTNRKIIERGVHREQLVVGARRRRTGGPGCGELGPDAERQQAADEEEDERVDRGTGSRSSCGRSSSATRTARSGSAGRRACSVVVAIGSLLTGPSACRSCSDGPCRRRRRCRPASGGHVVGRSRRRPWKISPLKTSSPVGDPSWISTLCGDAASWLSKSIVNGVSAGAVELGLVEGDVLGRRASTGAARRPGPGPAPDGRLPDGGGGVALRLGDLLLRARRRSRPGSGRGRRTASSRGPAPHSSAHWPRNVWPASGSSTVKSNVLSCPGTTSRLNRNCGT